MMALMPSALSQMAGVGSKWWMTVASVPDQEAPQHDLAGRQIGEVAHATRRRYCTMAVASASAVLCTASSNASVSSASPSNFPSIFRRGEWTTRTLTGLPPKVPANSETSGEVRAS